MLCSTQSGFRIYGLNTDIHSGQRWITDQTSADRRDVGFPSLPHVQASRLPAGIWLMALFIRVDLGFYTHRKTLRLFTKIGESAYWVPPRLWAYAANQQIDGEFQNYSAEEIALLIHYPGNAQAMLQALIDSGFMDVNPLRIHDWNEYNAFHAVFSERAKKAARARWSKEKERTKEKEGTEESKTETETEKYQASSSNASSINGDFALEAGAPSKQSKARGSVAECVAYAREKELPDSDGQWFFDKAEGSGWRNGGEPIKDWKATMRSWKGAGIFPSQKNKTYGNGNHSKTSGGAHSQRFSPADERNRFIVGADETRRAIAEESERRKREPKPWDNLPGDAVSDGRKPSSSGRTNDTGG